ncbi:MAG: hypothetical protein HY814_02500 [Candidatus Riflebacteria bacterium]|nr:hypothetical protein [Candidatus Riflebacteria bacterium]
MVYDRGTGSDTLGTSARRIPILAVFVGLPGGGTAAGGPPPPLGSTASMPAGALATPPAPARATVPLAVRA